MEENKDYEDETGEMPESSENQITAEEKPRDTLAEDLSELRADFPELSDIESITELDNPLRYAALRNIGLSPSEAFLLSSKRFTRQDNRSHLTSSVPRAAKSPEAGLGKRDLEELRHIFGDISDADIYKLYKKVTK